MIFDDMFVKDQTSHKHNVIPDFEGYPACYTVVA